MFVKAGVKSESEAIVQKDGEVVVWDEVTGDDFVFGEHISAVDVDGCGVRCFLLAISWSIARHSGLFTVG